MPELTKLNPVTGFKNLFALKSLVELLKSILKLACLACIIGIVLWQGVGALALSPFLGLKAVLEVFGRVATEMLLCTVLVFKIVGVADILMQPWLFLRDQKMSLQEMRRRGHAVRSQARAWRPGTSSAAGAAEPGPGPAASEL
jgi:type III secretion protein U